MEAHWRLASAGWWGKLGDRFGQERNFLSPAMRNFPGPVAIERRFPALALRRILP
jgi:hypothetical protein